MGCNLVQFDRTQTDAAHTPTANKQKLYCPRDANTKESQNLGTSLASSTFKSVPALLMVEECLVAVLLYVFLEGYQHEKINFFLFFLILFKYFNFNNKHLI